MRKYFTMFKYRHELFNSESEKTRLQDAGCQIDMLDSNDMFEEFFSIKRQTIKEILDLRTPPSDVLDVKVHICNHDRDKPCEVVTLKEFKEIYKNGKRN